MRDTADIIKSSITMTQVADFYGYHSKRSGFICCPFHNEKTPSLKLHNAVNKGFYCFGCGTGGSVIDFVKLANGLDFMDAIKRLNDDFKLGLNLERPDRKQMKLWQHEQRKKENEHRQNVRDLNRLLDEYRRLHFAKIDHAPKNIDDLHPEYVAACHRIEYIDYLIGLAGEKIDRRYSTSGSSTTTGQSNFVRES